MRNNWKIEIESEGTWLKVTGFPVPEGAPVSGESMWGKQVGGTDNDGVGVLDNEPAFCTEVKLGDLVRYGGGSDEIKPSFVEKVAN